MASSTILSERRVRDALDSADQGVEVRLYDSKVPGLLLWRRPGGKARWYVFKRAAGRMRRIAIGTICNWPTVPVEQARDLGLGLIASLVDGKNPAADRKREREKREAPPAPTLATAWDKLEKASQGKVRETTLVRYRRSWRCSIARLSDRPIADLTADIVEVWHADIGQANGRYEANHAMRLLKRICRQAMKWGMLTRDPTFGVEAFEHRHRDRVPSTTDMDAIWRELDAEHPTLRDFFRCLALTGQRRTAVCRMSWAAIDLAGARWQIPAAECKGKKPQKVDLRPEVVEILTKRLDARTAGAPWVFESPGKHGVPLNDPWCAWRRIQNRAGISDPIRMHDLRRWYASALVNAGVKMETVSKMLGHANPTVTAKVYAHLTDDTAREALKKLPVPKSTPIANIA